MHIITGLALMRSMGSPIRDNNCSRGREVYVIVPEPMRPDLIVNLPRVDNDRVQAGSSIRVIFTIENQGDGHSGPTEVTAYLSDDRTITVHDEFVASVNIRDLEPVHQLGLGTLQHNRPCRSWDLLLRRLCGCGYRGSRTHTTTARQGKQSSSRRLT